MGVFATADGVGRPAERDGGRRGMRMVKGVYFRGNARLPGAGGRAARVAALPAKDWAMLAYIAGDNNLSAAGLEDIAEMCETGAAGDVHAAVQIDTEGEFDGVVRYEVTEKDATGKAHRKVIERLPELDSGDPAVLSASLRWGLARYPAGRRLVVVWNHGSGFRSARRDIAYDDLGGSLDMPEIVGAMTAAGVGPAAPLDILGFDACLMCMAEIVWCLRDTTRFIVGSQQTEPGDGWPYERVLASLRGNPTAKGVASAIVKAYISDYKSRGEVGVTQSAVDTSKIAAVITRLGALGAALRAALPGAHHAIATARAETQAYEYNDYVDAVDLATRVAKSLPACGPAAKALAKAVAAAVVAQGSYGAAVAASHGLSMWFPADRSIYLAHRATYRALGFPASWAWPDFLDRYHA